MCSALQWYRCPKVFQQNGKESVAVQHRTKLRVSNLFCNRCMWQKHAYMPVSVVSKCVEALILKT